MLGSFTQLFLPTCCQTPEDQTDHTDQTTTAVDQTDQPTTAVDQTDQPTTAADQTDQTTTAADQTMANGHVAVCSPPAT